MQMREYPHSRLSEQQIVQLIEEATRHRDSQFGSAALPSVWLVRPFNFDSMELRRVRGRSSDSTELHQVGWSFIDSATDILNTIDL
jgi:hypothetical protein